MSEDEALVEPCARLTALRHPGQAPVSLPPASEGDVPRIGNEVRRDVESFAHETAATFTQNEEQPSTSVSRRCPRWHLSAKYEEKMTSTMRTYKGQATLRAATQCEVQ